MEQNSKIPNRKKLKRILLRDVYQLLLEKMTEYGDNGICMSYSYLISKILNNYGISCEPRTVKVMFLNGLAQQMIKEKGFLYLNSEIQKQKESNLYTLWTQGVGIIKSRSEFHAIIYFPNENSILDGTCIGFSRKEYNHNVKNYWNSINNLPDYIFSSKYPEESIKGGESLLFNFDKRLIFTGKIGELRPKKIEEIISLIISMITPILNKNCKKSAFEISREVILQHKTDIKNGHVRNISNT